jgi:hypothetical protein
LVLPVVATAATCCCCCTCCCYLLMLPVDVAACWCCECCVEGCGPTSSTRQQRGIDCSAMPQSTVRSLLLCSLLPQLLTSAYSAHITVRTSVPQLLCTAAHILYCCSSTSSWRTVPAV